MSQNKIGNGARVFVFHGEHAEEKYSVFRQLLEQSGLAERLERRTAELKKNAAELRIIIKPSFMLGYHLKDRSIITDRELLHELGKFLREHGYGKAVLVESANIYDRFFRSRGVPDVAAYFGMETCGMPIISASDDQVTHTYMRGMNLDALGPAVKKSTFVSSGEPVRSRLPCARYSTEPRPDRCRSLVKDAGIT